MFVDMITFFVLKIYFVSVIFPLPALVGNLGIKIHCIYEIDN